MTKAVITQKPDGTVTFDLVLPQAKIASEYQKVLAEAAKTIELKGFRKGKAPLKLVEAQSDRSQLYSHVLDHLLSPSYSEVIIANKLNPLVEPQVSPKSMEEGKDWTLAVTVAVSPEVELGDYAKYVKSALSKHGTAHKEVEPKDEKGKEEARDHKLNVIFDSLLKQAKLAVSPLLVEEEAKSALSRLVTQLKSLKLSVEDYAKSVKKTTDELVNEYKSTAETNLKLEFILQKLIELQKPEITEAAIAELKPQKGQEGYAKYVLQKRTVLDKLSAL
jgi:FKBP-type peptidyl-prolyl cis-trans isomerase (trigger factor)